MQLATIIHNMYDYKLFKLMYMHILTYTKDIHAFTTIWTLVACLIRTYIAAPSSLGLRVYISGESLVPMYGITITYTYVYIYIYVRTYTYVIHVYICTFMCVCTCSN